jgi:hypothetical protein
MLTPVAGFGFGDGPKLDLISGSKLTVLHWPRIEYADRRLPDQALLGGPYNRIDALLMAANADGAGRALVDEISAAGGCKELRTCHRDRYSLAQTLS